MRGQAVYATPGNISVSDTRVTQVERRSEKYKILKDSFWTEFQEIMKKNNICSKEMSNNIEQIMHDINGDDIKIRRGALVKWTKMYINGELNEYETDKIKKLSDNLMKQQAMLDKLQETGLLKKEDAAAKKRKLLIKGKIKPILEEVNRRMEWTRPFCTQE